MIQGFEAHVSFLWFPLIITYILLRSLHGSHTFTIVNYYKAIYSLNLLSSHPCKSIGQFWPSFIYLISIFSRVLHATIYIHNFPLLFFLKLSWNLYHWDHFFMVTIFLLVILCMGTCFLLAYPYNFSSALSFLKLYRNLEKSASDMKR